jgi:hypothetical protein
MDERAWLRRNHGAHDPRALAGADAFAPKECANFCAAARYEPDWRETAPARNSLARANEKAQHEAGLLLGSKREAQADCSRSISIWRAPEPERPS